MMSKQETYKSPSQFVKGESSPPKSPQNKGKKKRKASSKTLQGSYKNPQSRAYGGGGSKGIQGGQYSNLQGSSVKLQKKKHKSGHKTKPQGKGIVKALGQKKTTGNFKKIEKKKGKGAAIGALQNKLAKHRGQPAPYHRKHKKAEKTGKELLYRAMKKMSC